MATLEQEVAYLLWQVNQGYILAEDRAIGSDNWFTTEVGTEHPDDEKERPGWLSLASDVLALLRTEVVDRPICNGCGRRIHWHEGREEWTDDDGYDCGDDDEIYHSGYHIPRPSLT